MEAQTVLLIAGALAFYFLGSYIHSWLSGDQEMGSSTTSYSCPSCGHHFNWMREIRGREGQALKCSGCGESITIPG